MVLFDYESFDEINNAFSRYVGNGSSSSLPDPSGTHWGLDRTLVPGDETTILFFRQLSIACPKTIIHLKKRDISFFGIQPFSRHLTIRIFCAQGKGR